MRWAINTEFGLACLLLPGRFTNTGESILAWATLIDGHWRWVR